MSVTITISDEVAQHLQELASGDSVDIDHKLRRLLDAEYRRRVAAYQVTAEQLSRKYEMDFAAFEQQALTRQRGYSWEVESDAIAWETALDGIQTIQRLLTELHKETAGSDDLGRAV